MIEFFSKLFAASDKAEIRRLNEELERRVQERTAELEETNHKLEIQIAERKQTEERFRLVIESAPNAIVMSNTEGIITLVNTQAEVLFGYQREELFGKSVELLVPTRFRKKHPDYRSGFNTHPETRAMGAGRDLYALKKDGTEVPVEIGLNPIHTDQGVQVLSAIVDITARKKAEAALETHARELSRSNEELEQFAYVASHDLREPLRMVSNFVQLLERHYKGKLDSNADEYIYFAVDGAKRMQILIDDLLTFSRVGTRGKPFQPTHIQAVLTQVCQDLQLIITENQAQIVFHDLPTIIADDIQMAQLFQNLITNAIKFHSDHPPYVQITARQEENQWHFIVSDNGIGIDPKFADRIFDIFQRLHTREEYEGTGIGLAVCKKIVERHGGQIWVESSLEQGTTFHFTIPNRRHS